MKSSQLPEKLWPVLKGLVGAIIAVTLLGWFFLRDGETSRPWISHVQFARGEVLNLSSIGGAAPTLGTAGIALVYIRATPDDDWTQIAGSYYEPTGQKSPGDPYFLLSHDGNLLCDSSKLTEVRWAFDFSSQKNLRFNTNDLQQIAALRLQLKRLIARHGALAPVKCQSWRASRWKWADTQAKQLMQEVLSQTDL